MQDSWSPVQRDWLTNSNLWTTIDACINRVTLLDIWFNSDYPSLSTWWLKIYNPASAIAFINLLLSSIIEFDVLLNARTSRVWGHLGILNSSKDPKTSDGNLQSWINSICKRELSSELYQHYISWHLESTDSSPAPWPPQSMYARQSYASTHDKLARTQFPFSFHSLIVLHLVYKAARLECFRNKSRRHATTTLGTVRDSQYFMSTWWEKPLHIEQVISNSWSPSRVPRLTRMVQYCPRSWRL